MGIDVTIKIKNGEKYYNIYKTRDECIILENQDCEGTPVSEKQIFDVLDKFYQKEFSLTPKLTKQQIEIVNAYEEKIDALFHPQGDHQKEVDEIFARMASSSAKIAGSAISATNASNEQLLDIIKAARKYVYQANFAAEEKHETLGIFYQDSSIYSAMEETKDLLSRIDAVVNASTKTPMVGSSITAKVTKSENEADLFPVKGQELHVYTGNRPLALGEHPSGILLCKAIFGEKATIIISGEASYGLLVKNNQYVASINIDTVPGKGTLCISELFLCQGDCFLIDNWW